MTNDNFYCTCFDHLGQCNTKFCAIGFLNEADTLESSSILFYSFQEQSIKHKRDGRMPVELKWVIIKKGNYSGIFTINQGF